MTERPMTKRKIPKRPKPPQRLDEPLSISRNLLPIVRDVAESVMLRNVELARRYLELYQSERER